MAGISGTSISSGATGSPRASVVLLACVISLFFIWGGITSLYMLIVGITTAISFIIFLEMLGLGAHEEKTAPK